MILYWQSESLRYKIPEVQIQLLKFHFTLFDTIKVEFKLSNTLVTGIISQVSSPSPFVCYPLGLVLKNEGWLWKIFYFIFSQGFSVNGCIHKITHISVKQEFIMWLQNSRKWQVNIFLYNAKKNTFCVIFIGYLMSDGFWDSVRERIFIQKTAYFLDSQYCLFF